MSKSSSQAVSTEASAPSADRTRPPAERLLSLDALRGFDMFWILGAEAVVHDLAKVHRGPVVQMLDRQMEHKPWEGFAFYDLIFPLFVFIAGVSLVFSLSKLIETEGREAAVKRVVIRSAILFLLGILYYGGFSKHFADVRLLGVLQRIALCYLSAGLLFCFLRVNGLVAVVVALLVGYWSLLTYVPVPGIGPPSFAEGKNLANYVDAQYLPGRKWDGDHDPEGLLSTLPAVASCLLGVLAGLLLKNNKIRPYEKVFCLLLAGGAGVGLGFAWGMEFPVIKKLWTSSFVLVAGGYSAMLLGAFYLVLDVWQWRHWAGPLVWIGVNPITLYLLDGIVNFRDLAERCLGGDLSQLVFRHYGPLAVSTLALLLMLALARFLYARQIFLRV
jgi:predicted acyltransferase